MGMVKDDSALHHENAKRPQNGQDIIKLQATNTYRGYDGLDENVECHENVDYSGAHKKTDPAEITLVRKLDWHIMPT